jgi:integrase
MARRIRRAHLRALHTKDCGLGETAFEWDSWRRRCKCQPRYRIQHRDEQGRWVRETVGRDRRDAETRLAEVNAALGRGTWARQVVDVPFDEWADTWYESLERPKANTLRDYRTTVAYAKAAFGSKPLQEIQHADLVKFLRSLGRTIDAGTPDERFIEAGATTKRKHLRVLSAMFNVAAKRDLITANPVDKLDASELPRAAKHKAPWFEDDELARIKPDVPAGLYRTMFTLAYKTGLREGELIALTWGDVGLQENVIRVRRTYVEGLGVQDTPKTKAGNRDVYVTADVVELVGAWWGECGRPDDPAQLVFPGSKSDGCVPGSFLTRGVLYPAMQRAGVDREHAATGEKRTWHSLRHTYARLCIEAGVGLKELQEQMGHESWSVTDQTYSHVSARARAKLVESLTFSV